MKTLIQYISESNDANLDKATSKNDVFYAELAKFVFSLNKKPIYLTGVYPYLEKANDNDELGDIYKLVDGNKTADLSDKGIEKIGAKYANNADELSKYLASNSGDTMQLIGLGKFDLSNAGVVADSYIDVLINAMDNYDSEDHYLYLYFSDSEEGNNVYLVLNNEIGTDDDITGDDPNDYLNVDNNGIKQQFNTIKKALNKLK